MSDYEKFKDESASKENFCSLLTCKNFQIFKMKTMRDYHNLYIKYDVLLLGDVFGKFRNSSLKKYGSCPSYYLRAPALTWDGMHNMNKFELELILEVDMYLFF